MTRSYVRAPEGYVRGHGGALLELPDLPPGKDDAPCCNARRDQLGRPPIGYCSTRCIRRPKPTTPTTGARSHG